jgi:hypothetical protein
VDIKLALAPVTGYVFLYFGDSLGWFVVSNENTVLFGFTSYVIGVLIAVLSIKKVAD